MQPKQLLYILFFLLGSKCFGQSFYLNIKGTNEKQNQTIDSVNYNKAHTNLKSLTNEIASVAEKLTKQGYLDIITIENRKINDSSFTAIFDLKTRIKTIHIYIGTNNIFFDTKKTPKDSLIIPYSDLENLLNREIENKEKEGFAFSKIKLANIKRKNSTIYADLILDSEKKRILNSIILNHTDSKDFFPKGALKQLNKKYTNKTFNQEAIKNLHSDINSFDFISQTKYPEILFTTDSTKVYTYIEKRKANTFDGYIGFSNDENKKLNLNGYVDISLVNTLRAGEKFSLYWKSDGNQQKTFNTKIEIPYLFQSPIGIKAQLNIFKQDSTFQNTKTDINLGYYLNYNSKLYLGYQSTESSDIQNTNNSTLSDFNNSYITTSYDFQKSDFENTIFFNKAFIAASFGFGNRTTNNSIETAGKSNQFFTNLNLKYNFELNSKNFININSQNIFLKSKNYISNELFRFGGMNSIRGFLENSLQANFATMILTEYRYLISQTFYINSILDYSLYQDQTSISNKNNIKKLLGIGIGATIQTTSGILRINLSNGGENTTNLQFYNTIVNISYNVKF
ncbi:hypothetical protein NYQ10_01905 [Flavobacterium johnsoniae]|uniref:hypothetical protein n=1 Tax=Flavobacterium johnsoniae TaxID=986 RepID=UPI0025B09749|nr:hypothetical protein [Flavobacterium johnsoniae]WJS95219.1 hypothetical protein NYQ10_01905 [Flavobacterium johnsoniae]